MDLVVIAAGRSIRDLPRLNKMHGEERWRKLKGRASVRLPSGRLAVAEPIHFAVCVRNRGNAASLELRKLYELVPDPDAEKDGMLRVIDESGEDYPFPTSYFVLTPLSAAIEEAVQLAVGTAGLR